MNKGLINLIATNQLFENVDVSQINFENVKGDLLTFSEGTLIFSEGSPADKVYLVMDGKVNLLKKGDLGAGGKEIFEKDTFFGFEELVEGVNRISSAVALSDAYLIAFTKEEARAIIRQNERIKENIVKYSGIPDVNVIHSFLVSEELKEEGFVASEAEEIIGEETEEAVPIPPDVPDEFLSSEFSPPIDVEDEAEEQNIPLPEEPISIEEETSVEAEKPGNTEESGAQETDISLEPPDIYEDMWDNYEEADNPSPVVDETILPPVEEEISEMETPPDLPSPEKTVGGEEESSVEIKEETEQSPVLQVSAEEILKSTDKIFLSFSESEALENFAELCAEATVSEVYLLFSPDENNNLTAKRIFEEKEVIISEPLEDTTVGRVFSENEPLIISLPEEWHKFKTKSFEKLGKDINSLLFFPLRIGEERKGVLTLINKAGGKFDERDVETVKRFFDLLAGHLERLGTLEAHFAAQRENISENLTNYLGKTLRQKIVLVKKYLEKITPETEETRRLVSLGVETVSEALRFFEEMKYLNIDKKELRLTELKFDDFLSDFLREHEALFKEKYINVFRNLNSDSFVKIDAKLLSLAFHKISENAFEAMPYGGNFVVKTFSDGDYVTALFSDSGKKIDEEILGIAFEPFVSKDKEGHAGLGLALAKKIIEAHFGKVEIFPNEKEGTTVKVKLPVMKF